MLAQDLGGLLVAVDCQVIKDDNSPRRDLWDENMLNVLCEGFAIHRPWQTPGCDQRIVGKACDEGLGLPIAKGRIHMQSLPFGSPPS